MALLVARIWHERAERRARGGGADARSASALVVAPPFLHLRAEYGDAARALARSSIGVAVHPRRRAGVRCRNRDVALIALTIPIIAIPLAANPMMRAIGARRSEAGFDAAAPPIGDAANGSRRHRGLHRLDDVLPAAGRSSSSRRTPRSSRATTSSATTTASPARPRSSRRRGSHGVARRRAAYLIVRANDKAHRAQLEQRGMRLVAASARYVAYR